MEKFIWEHIVCRFGVPEIIISDNGKQFAKGIFIVFCQRIGIYESFTLVYHPQANGQVEVTNRDIIKGMERILENNHQGWVDELPQVLWAHKTSPKSNNGETPFSLTYDSEAIVPIEICVETERVKEFNVRKNEKRRREDLDILEERREITFIREVHYKLKLERYYNKHVGPSTFKLDVGGGFEGLLDGCGRHIKWKGYIKNGHGSGDFDACLVSRDERSLCVSISDGY
nr:reverse transcriptase domain-containing protein [Tanacetum cinerariifolium]